MFAHFLYHKSTSLTLCESQACVYIICKVACIYFCAHVNKLFTWPAQVERLHMQVEIRYWPYFNHTYWAELITVKNLFINTIFYNKVWVKIKYWSQLLTHCLKKKNTFLQVWKTWGWVNEDARSYIMPTPAINVASQINCSYYNKWSSILWKSSLQSIIMQLKLNNSLNIIYLNILTQYSLSAI